MIIKNQQLVFSKDLCEEYCLLKLHFTPRRFSHQKKISKVQGNTKVIKVNRFCFYLSVVFYVEAKRETVWTNTLHQEWMAPYIKDVGGHEPFASFFSSLLIEFIVS